MSGLDVEGVLSAHEYEISYRPTSICRCGFSPSTALTGRLTPQQDYHRAHVAAVLREQIDGALAEARFAGKADAMAEVLDPKGPIWNRMHGDGWDNALGSLNDHSGAPPNPYRAERAGDAE